jgi:glycerophosphoryl diester phosphodiesterase
MRAWPFPLWIAHRGAGRLAPENTLAAFRIGASYGYRAFECDVKVSADDVPFLLHDATLERTTGKSGNAGDRLWAQLSLLDAGAWHSRGFAGEPLASLASIAAYVRGNDFALDLEIKAAPGHEERTGRVVAGQVRQLWAGATTPPLLSSFRPESLAAARDVAPELPRGLLLETLWDGWLDMATSLACVAVITNHPVMDSTVLDRLHAAGMRGLCYTVNDPAEAQRLLALGIDGIITDAVDRFPPALWSETPAD